MPCGRDAGRTVDVTTDVALLGEKRRTGVQTDPHLDLPRREGLRHLSRGSKGPWCGGEGEEEGVSLRVDLDPVVASAGFADDPAMLRQGIRVALGAELMQEPRRPLDVGEEEGDSASREIRAHGEIICQNRTRLKQILIVRLI